MSTCSPLLLARYLDNRLGSRELLECLDHVGSGRTGCQTCRQALMEVRRWEHPQFYQAKYRHLVPAPTGLGAAVLNQLERLRQEPVDEIPESTPEVDFVNDEAVKEPSELGETDIVPEKVLDAPAVTRETEENMVDDKDLELRVVEKLSERVKHLRAQLAEAVEAAGKVAASVEVLADRLTDYERALRGLEEVRMPASTKKRGAKTPAPPMGCRYDSPIMLVLAAEGPLVTPELVRHVQLAVPNLAKLRFDSARAIVHERVQTLMKGGLITGKRVKGPNNPWRWDIADRKEKTA